VFNYRTYLVCFLLGGLIAFVLTPVVIRLALRLGAVDQPHDRKMHPRAVPRLGGLAIYIGMWIPLVLLCYYDNAVARRVQVKFDSMFLIFAGGFVMLLLGALDDLRGLNARKKFLVQFPLALLLVHCGISFTGITLPGYGTIALGPWGPVLAVLWLVGVTNSLNLIDGIDGLAAGAAFFVSATNALIAVCYGNVLMAVVMCSMAGACLGFLRYNFPPASVFLGDTGSLFLGMTLAISSVTCSAKGTVAASLLIPVLVLGYPIIDTLLAMGRRAILGKSMFSGDAGHIHHRLLAKGLSHRCVTLVLYGVCGIFCAAALAMVMENQFYTAIGLAVILCLVCGGFCCLGYLKQLLSLPARHHQERNQFQLIYHYAEMMKAKIGLAPDLEGVFELLRQSAAELEMAELDVTLSGGAAGPPIHKAWQFNGHSPNAHPAEAATPGGLKEEVYQFEDTGLRAQIRYAQNGKPEELQIEERGLLYEVFQSANERLMELAHDAAVGLGGLAWEKKG